MSSSAPSDAATLYQNCRSTDLNVQSAAYRTLWRLLYQGAWNLLYDQIDGADLAEDCAQQALMRIHQRLHECNQPAAFLSWSQRIVANLTIDELRRRKRFSGTTSTQDEGQNPLENVPVLPEMVSQLEIEELRTLLQKAPISDRSRRVVVGRFFDQSDDEQLAQVERELSGEAVLSSHVQVTRAKNLAKLRNWQPLREYLRVEEIND
ncbi:MAG: sigma-70 family RNA polymerase sigma factor [Caldilineaceae bacterium]